MNRRGVIALGAGIIFFAVLFVSVRPRKEAEPTVSGLPISRWLRTVRGLEVGNVAEAGTNAIPFLARAVRARDLIPYTWQVAVWRRLPASWRPKVKLPMPASEVRQNALVALRDFGVEAEAALPAVVEAAMRDSDVSTRSYALQAAVAINANHPDVVPLLQQRLRSADMGTHANALMAIYNAGTFPRSLTNLIALDLGDTNQLFFNELVALGTLQQEVSPFVPRIIPFLAGETARGNALAALQRVGPGGAAAVPALIRCLQNPQRGVGAAAAEVLMGIGPGAREAVPALEELMREGSLVTRVMSASARRQITDDPSLSVHVILAALGELDDDSHWSPFPGAFGLRNFGFNSRMTAIWFAGELGPAATEALPTLVQLMEKGPDWQRVVAARSVWKIRGSPESSLPVLQACMSSKDEHTRTLACYIAGEIGPAAARLLPDLESASRTTLRTRRAALAAIQSIRQIPSSPVDSK